MTHRNKLHLFTRTVCFLCFTVLLATSNWGCSEATTQDKASEAVPFLVTIADSTIQKDSTLFMIEFTFTEFLNKERAEWIRKEASHINGLRAIEISPEKRTGTFYLDTFELYKEVLVILQDGGFQLEEQFVISGPGITCDIPAEHNEGDIVPEAPITAVQPSLGTLKKMFNENQDKIRIVSIPNPSCLACVKGQRFVNQLFEKHPDQNEMISLVIWTSINGWGKYKDAKRLISETKDGRLSHFWDANMIVGKEFKKPLLLDPKYETAWDVYLIYEPGIQWRDEAPKPSFWMHQLESNRSGADSTLFLDKNTFEQKLDEFLSMRI